MTFANIRYSISCPRLPNSKPNERQKLRHGGPRNFADTLTYELTAKQARTQRDAWAFADWQGMTLNYWLTIQWARLDISDRQAGKALRQFLDNLRDYLRKGGFPVLWTYVRENGDTKGSHVHILFYLPSAAAGGFHALRKGWLERIAGRSCPQHAVKGYTLPRNAKWSDAPKEGEFKTKAEAMQADSWFCHNYTIKGIAPHLADEFNLKFCEAGGAIIGKRCGVSRALNAAAMAKLGYTPPERHPMADLPHRKPFRC